VGGVSSPPTLRVYPPAADNVQSGLDAVLAGSYDVPGLAFGHPPVILDLGAHVGSFSVWAAHRWPGAQIHAFEPHPESAAYCRTNVEGLAVTVQNLAVVGHGRPNMVMLFEGRHNTGQRSIYLREEQRDDGGTWVTTCPSRMLPPCDILKIDTEGCEVEILENYPHLAGVTCVMLEWHSVADYRHFLTWLPSLGLPCVRDDARGEWVSDRNLVFLRRRPAAALPGPGATPEAIGENAERGGGAAAR